MDAVIAFMQKVVEFIPGQEWTMLIFITSIVELVFRLFKTEKPLSIAWLVVGIIKKVGTILELGAKVISKVATLLDKVLPQKTV